MHFKLLGPEAHGTPISILEFASRSDVVRVVLMQYAFGQYRLQVWHKEHPVGPDY